MRRPEPRDPREFRAWPLVLLLVVFVAVEAALVSLFVWAVVTAPGVFR